MPPSTKTALSSRASSPRTALLPAPPHDWDELVPKSPGDPPCRWLGTPPAGRHKSRRCARPVAYAPPFRGFRLAAEIWQDLRHAARSLRRNSRLAALIVSTLALGVGAAVAIFSLVNALLLQPLGVQQPERLVL